MDNNTTVTCGFDVGRANMNVAFRQWYPTILQQDIYMQRWIKAERIERDGTPAQRKRARNRKHKAMRQLERADMVLRLRFR